jgi:hypothetical protein
MTALPIAHNRKADHRLPHTIGLSMPVEKKPYAQQSLKAAITT